MIKIKTSQQIEIMKLGGQISSDALNYGLSLVKVGITTYELDRLIGEFILSRGAQASFKTVDDYPFTTCININEGIVHGLPNNYEIKKGDIVSIDLGVLFKGYHTDLSYTVEVDTNKEARFLDSGKLALHHAIKSCRVGKKIGDVSYAMQKIIESAGYTVSYDLVGHGIGVELHEDPYVPCYGEPNTGIKLKEGMVLAIEVIYQKGSPDIKLSADNWTYETADKSLSGLFEKTVAITGSGPIMLTNY